MVNIGIAFQIIRQIENTKVFKLKKTHCEVFFYKDDFLLKRTEEYRD